MAGYDQLGPSSDPSKGDYYRINALPGGQCGAATQTYEIDVYCQNFFCGTGPDPKNPGQRKLASNANIKTGAGIGLNFTFP
jgi:hypothetical protein